MGQSRFLDDTLVQQITLYVAYGYDDAVGLVDDLATDATHSWTSTVPRLTRLRDAVEKSCSAEPEVRTLVVKKIDRWLRVAKRRSA